MIAAVRGGELMSEQTFEVRKYGHQVPLGDSTCRNCGRAMKHNLAGPHAIVMHVDDGEPNDCRDPWPAVGTSRAYVAPISGGAEWTDVGYVTDVEWATPPAELTVNSYAPRSLAATTNLTLRPDDGRDQPPLPDVSHLHVTPPAVDGGPVVGALPQNLVVHGIYERCDRCLAPVVEPFPDDWRMDVHVAERGGRIAFTPHRPGCDAPTQGCVMPGVKLLNLDIDWERWGR